MGFKVISVPGGTGGAPASHSHVVSDVSGLQTALDNKADDGHTHVASDIDGAIAAVGTADFDVVAWSTVNGWVVVSKEAYQEALTLHRTTAVFDVIADGTAVTTGDGKRYIPVPSTLNGKIIAAVEAYTRVPGTGSGTTDIQVARVRAGVAVDMLTTKAQLAVGAYSGLNAVVDTANDDLETGDFLRIDVDAVNGTPPTGLFVVFIYEAA